MRKVPKVLYVLLAISLLFAVLVGCTNNSSKTTSDEKVTLEFIRWSNGPVLDAEEEDKVKRFNESHPNIEVKMTLLPWDETFKKIELSLATDNPVDIFYWDTPAYAWYKKGLFKNLQPYFDRDLDMSEYEGALFEPLKFDKENMYIAPENFQTIALYYNKTMFEKAGVAVPDGNWTWDDVRAAAQKLTVKEGDKTTQFGYDVAALNTWWAWQALTAEQGGQLVSSINDPDSITLNTPETTNALQFLQDLIYKDGVAPDAAKMNALGGGFMTGKIGMYVGGDWDLGSLREITDFEWDMAPLPKWGDTRVTPYFIGGYVMTENSKHPEEAWEFLKWTMTDNQTTLAEQQSWIPVHNSSREAAKVPDWAPSGYQITRFDWTNYGIIGDIYHTKWREAHDKFISPMQDKIFTSGGSVPDALEEAEKQINALLKE